MNARWQVQLSLYHRREAMRTAVAPEGLSASTATHCVACAVEVDLQYRRSPSLQGRVEVEVEVRQRERPRQLQVSCQIVVSTLLARQLQRHLAHHRVYLHSLVAISLYSLREGKQER